MEEKDMGKKQKHGRKRYFHNRNPRELKQTPQQMEQEKARKKQTTYLWIRCGLWFLSLFIILFIYLEISGLINNYLIITI